MPPKKQRRDEETKEVEAKRPKHEEHHHFSGLTTVANADQQAAIAPGGARDNWADSGTIGCLVWYSGDTTDVLHCGDATNTANITNYSVDGGITWHNITYNVAPLQNMATIGSDGAGNWVAICGGNDNSYTSTDGKSFTQSTVAFPTTAGITSSNIIWYTGTTPNIWVLACISSATSAICTSQDGKTWVTQATQNTTNTSTGNFSTLATDDPNSIIVVALGTVAANLLQWSNDGVHWTAGTFTGGGPSQAVGLSYSKDKSQFFFQDPSNGTGFVSGDGKAWTNLGSGFGSNGAISTFWCPNYKHWYLVNPDSANGSNYALWTTPDVSATTGFPFRKTILDGSRNAVTGYLTGCYLPKYDRFIIGTSSSGGVAYSTARPSKVKSVADEILVRGFPASVAHYSQFSSTSVSHTIVDTTFPTPGSYLGSLTFQPTMPNGMVIELDVNLVLTTTSGMGDTLTLSYKTTSGGTTSTLFQHICSVAAGTPTQVSIRSKITVTSSSGIQFNTVLLNSNATTSSDFQTGTHGFTSTSANTLSLSGLWATNVSTATLNQFFILCHYSSVPP